jgi:tRNA(fMet)-specific endonuclease VapC
LTKSLIDTDILSFYFKGDSKVIDAVSKYFQSFTALNISIITYFEITGGLMHKKAQSQLNDFEIFAASNNLISISKTSAKISGEVYAELRKQGITIGTSDLLIAGIALENNLTLVTNNEKHYSHIKALRIENWKL